MGNLASAQDLLSSVAKQQLLEWTSVSCFPHDDPIHGEIIGLANDFEKALKTGAM